MATVYSLVCWGGKDGKTVTMTVASPCVVSLTNHGLRDGTGVVFSTTGALPTGVTAGTTYYSRSTATDTFNLYDTAAHAIAGGSTGIVNTSGSQSGTHTAKGAYYLGLTTEQKARYGSSGSERIFDGLKSWYANRSAATLSPYDSEVCEIGEAFTDTDSAGTLTIALVSASVTITSAVNGERSGAFHSGDINVGYLYYYSKNIGSSAIALSTPNCTVDGLRVHAYGTSTTAVSTSKMFCVVKNCVIQGRQTGGNGSQVGIGANAPASNIYNNIVYNVQIGISVAGYQNARGSTIYNNLCTACVHGVYSTSSMSGDLTVCNNVAVGNTNNWGNKAYIPTCASASGNAGESTDFVTVTFSNSSGLLLANQAAHGFSANGPVRFVDGGSAVAPAGVTLNTQYFVKTVISTDSYTIAPVSGGTAISYTDAGSGTMQVPLMWGNTGATDITVNSAAFYDYASKDFRPADNSSPQVNTGVRIYGGWEQDISDAVRPNYESASYPDNLWDVGPYEFDHGEGLAPSTVNVSITGMASGSEIAIYKASDMSAILAPQSTTGSYSGTYTYTGDTSIIVRVRKGTAATRYLPYEYAGTITSTGFQLVVSQIPDAIAQ